jgi:O-antigen/teichoic acid export membrane protein
MLTWNVLINVLAQMILFLVSFFTAPYVISKLGREEYGLLAILSAVLVYFSVMDFGWHEALVKKIAGLREKKEEKERGLVLGTALIGYLVWGTILAVLVCLLSPLLVKNVFLISGDLYGLGLFSFRMAALGLFFNFLGSFVYAVFEGQEKFGLYNIRTLVAGAGGSLLGAGLLFWGYGLREVWTGIVLVNLLALIIGGLILIKGGFWIKPEWKWSKRIAREMFGFGIYKFWGNFFEQVNQNGPKFLIGGILGTGAVTVFTVPLSLVQKSGVILSQLHLSIFPAASAMGSKKDWGRLKRIFWKGQLMVLGLMVPFLALGWFWGKVFLIWWLKDEGLVEEIWPIFKVLLVAYYFRAFSTVPVAVIEGLGNSKITAFFAGANAFLTLALMPLLLLKYGVVGAAYLVLGYILVGVPIFIWVFYKKWVYFRHA